MHLCMDVSGCVCVCVCVRAQIWAAKTFIFMNASKLCHSEISTMAIIQIQVIDLQAYLLTHTHTYTHKCMQAKASICIAIEC